MSNNKGNKMIKVTSSILLAGAITLSTPGVPAAVSAIQPEVVKATSMMKSTKAKENYILEVKSSEYKGMSFGKETIDVHFTTESGYSIYDNDQNINLTINGKDYPLGNKFEAQDDLQIFIYENPANFTEDVNEVILKQNDEIKAKFYLNKSGEIVEGEVTPELKAAPTVANIEKEKMKFGFNDIEVYKVTFDGEGIEEYLALDAEKKNILVNDKKYNKGSFMGLSNDQYIVFPQSKDILYLRANNELKTLKIEAEGYAPLEYTAESPNKPDAPNATLNVEPQGHNENSHKKAKVSVIGKAAAGDTIIVRNGDAEIGRYDSATTRSATNAYEIDITAAARSIDEGTKLSVVAVNENVESDAQELPLDITPIKKDQKKVIERDTLGINSEAVTSESLTKANKIFKNKKDEALASVDTAKTIDAVEAIEIDKTDAIAQLEGKLYTGAQNKIYIGKDGKELQVHFNGDILNQLSLGDFDGIEGKDIFVYVGKSYGTQEEELRIKLTDEYKEKVVAKAVDMTKNLAKSKVNNNLTLTDEEKAGKTQASIAEAEKAIQDVIDAIDKATTVTGVKAVAIPEKSEILAKLVEIKAAPKYKANNYGKDTENYFVEIELNGDDVNTFLNAITSVKVNDVDYSKKTSIMPGFEDNQYIVTTKAGDFSGTKVVKLNANGFKLDKTDKVEIAAEGYENLVIENLDVKTADKDALKAAITHAEEVMESIKYKNEATEGEKTQYADAVAEAKAINENSRAAQSEADTIIKTLEAREAVLDGVLLAPTVEKVAYEKAFDPISKGDRLNMVLAEGEATKLFLAQLGKEGTKVTVGGETYEKATSIIELTEGKYAVINNNIYFHTADKVENVEITIEAPDCETLTYNGEVEDALGDAKDAKLAELDKLVLTEEDKTGKTDESIKAVEDKIAELKKQVNDAQTVEAVEAVEVPTMDELKDMLVDISVEINATTAGEKSITVDVSELKAGDILVASVTKSAVRTAPTEKRVELEQADIDNGSKTIEFDEALVEGDKVTVTVLRGEDKIAEDEVDITKAPVSKRALKNAIRNDKKVKNSNNYKKASEDTKKAYDDALAEAKAVLADRAAEQEKVDEAVAKLKEAAKNLAPESSKPTPKPGRPSSGGGGNYSSVSSKRLAGNSRVATAVEVSKNIYANGTKNVVIANMNQFADVLTATPLAAQMKAPILFVNSDSIPQETMNEIKRLGAKNVTIIGGENSVSKSVEKQLEGKTIERIAGSDRYETSVKIAEKVREKGSKSVVEVANGAVFADGLSMSSLAIKQNAPIVLVQRDNLPASVLKAVSSWTDVKTVNIAGMHSSVSEAAEKVLASKVKVNRYGGADRYETAAKIAKAARPTATTAVYTSGEKFADALVAGPLAAKKSAPILLVKKNAVPASITEYTKRVNNIYVVGGESTVEQTVIERLLKIAK